MNNLTFSSPDLSSFCQLNNLGLTATGQHLCAERAVIECRLTKAPEPCPKCGAAGVSRGTVDRHLAHTPYGQRPTRLLLRIRRWRCACGCFWHEDTNSAAPPRSKLSYGAIRWALAAIVLDHLSVSRVASQLDVAWHTANNAIINEGRRLLFNDSTRFDGVTVLGVDEHVWRHTRCGDKYVTIVVDLTPVRNKTGRPACSMCWKAAPNKPLSNGYRVAPNRGVTRSKALPWTVLRGLNLQRKKPCLKPKPCWILSMSCAGQATCWMNAAGVCNTTSWAAEGVK